LSHAGRHVLGDAHSESALATLTMTTSAMRIRILVTYYGVGRILPVILEVLAFAGAAIVPLPEQLPRALPLFAIASVILWMRGHSWAWRFKGPAEYAAIGAAVGAGALVIALVLGQFVDAVWTQYPLVRGNGAQLFAFATIVVASEAALEVALRGWIVERLVGRSAVLAVLVGALAEIIVTRNVGSGVFGIALGWLYVAGGRSLTAPVCARVAFALGALLLEALRLVS